MTLDQVIAWVGQSLGTIGSAFIPKPDQLNAWHIMDLGEVVVQAVAVYLIWRALTIARRSHELAVEALEVSNRLQKASLDEYIDMLESGRYDALDRTYFELVRERTEHPEFNDPKSIYDNRQTESRAWVAYSGYAFRVWNFLESIYDKCQLPPAGADTKKVTMIKQLKETWWPIFQVEAKRHSHWINEKDNQGQSVNKLYFKNTFYTEAINMSQRPS
jgi:hypothetical protein